MSGGRPRTATAPDGTEIYFETHGDPARPAIFLGPHFYATQSADDGGSTDTWIERLRHDFFLVVADYPRGLGRTGHPQGLTYTPDIAAQEYGCIADAAGVDQFGWVGYSFGGAMGVQIACRTERVTALAVGGFPPLNAPFQLMIDIASQTVKKPPLLPKFIDPGVLDSTLGFYRPLVTWPERREISKLTMPRLAFMGDQDGAQESPQSGPLADKLRGVEDELCALGWQIEWLQGQDHASAQRPEVSLPVVHRFFREALLP